MGPSDNMIYGPGLKMIHADKTLRYVGMTGRYCKVLYSSGLAYGLLNYMKTSCSGATIV